MKMHNTDKAGFMGELFIGVGKGIAQVGNNILTRAFLGPVPMDKKVEEKSSVHTEVVVKKKEYSEDPHEFYSE